MLDVVNRFWWIPVLAALIVFWTISALRSRTAADRLVAVAALCDQHGMGRVERVGTQLMPRMLAMYQPTVRYTFANGDWSLWLAECSDPRGGRIFSVMMFSAEGLNMPYVGVARKGAVDLPLGSHGQGVQLESIDFTNRFDMRADDPRAAVMLVDEGMMQWLLDLDQVSFQITGPLVTALVRESSKSQHSVASPELLFQFQDGFVAHVPQLIFSEYRAPKELTAASRGIG